MCPRQALLPCSTQRWEVFRAGNKTSKKNHYSPGWKSPADSHRACLRLELRAVPVCSHITALHRAAPRSFSEPAALELEFLRGEAEVTRCTGPRARAPSPIRVPGPSSPRAAPPALSPAGSALPCPALAGRCRWAGVPAALRADPSPQWLRNAVCLGCAPRLRRRAEPPSHRPRSRPCRETCYGAGPFSPSPPRTFLPSPWSFPFPSFPSPPFCDLPSSPKGWWELRLFISRPYSCFLLYHPPQVILPPLSAPKHPHFRSCWYLSTPAKR